MEVSMADDCRDKDWITDAVLNDIDDTINKIQRVVVNNKESIEEIKQAINTLDMLFKQKMHWIRDEIHLLKGKSKRDYPKPKV